MTTNEVAKRCNVVRATVINWCKANNIKREIRTNGIAEYILTEKDVKKFENRASPGWKKGRSRKE